MYLSTTRSRPASVSSQRQEYTAVEIVAPATRCVAADLVDAGTCECSGEKRSPHASVELGELRPRSNERAERAGRGRDHGTVAGHLRDGRLIPEPA
jgi:hypothetical protein